MAEIMRNASEGFRSSGYALIISLKYSPGRAKEFFLIGKKLGQNGCHTRKVQNHFLRKQIGF